MVPAIKDGTGTYTSDVKATDLTEVEALRLENLQLKLNSLQMQINAYKQQMNQEVKRIAESLGFDPEKVVIDIQNRRIAEKRK